eukprot:9430916-Alexandrium_andersonii.AAC.1
MSPLCCTVKQLDDGARLDGIAAAVRADLALRLVWVVDGSSPDPARAVYAGSVLDECYFKRNCCA